ncbi:MAG: hypothetical protein AAB375_03525 [Patescibacteria group bacterium]
MLRHLRTFTPLIAGLIVLSVGIFFGVWWNLYDYIPHLDKILHILGGVTAAWFVLALMQREITHMGAWKQTLILVSISALIGVVWEWAEFASNYAQYSHPIWYFYFHGGDLADTMIDLAADTVGALLLTAWALYKER